jgi:vesicle-associated membrane protein 72
MYEFFSVFFFVFDFVAYCVVAIESAGRQIPIAFLERVKEEFSKKYAGGKAANASAKSLSKEYGYLIF